MSMGGLGWRRGAGFIAVVTIAFAGVAEAEVAVVVHPHRAAYAAAGAGTVTYGGGDLQPLVPARLLDTRDGNGGPVGKVGPQSTTVLQVGGRGGVPAVGAGAVVLNVTATEPTASSYVTVFPTGEARPTASNLNMAPGQTVPNLVVARLGKGGTVSLYNNNGEAHLVVDVAGWFPKSSALQPMNPVRLLDTRTGLGAPGPVGPGSETVLDVAGHGGIPATGAAAVILNVTVTEPAADSYVTVFPTGAERPTASNLNMTTGDTVPNLVVAKLGEGGAVSLYNNNGDTHLVADALGWFPESSQLHAMSPARLLDTREGNGAPKATVDAGSVVSLQVTGRGGVPAGGVGGVILNVTVTEPTAASYVTVYPTGEPRPLASNLNMRPGQTVANLVFAKLGVDGKVDLFNNAGSTHLIADVAGWFPDAGTDESTFELAPGTVLAGPGDVVSTTGTSRTGGTVTLAASADVPAAGGHLAVFPNERAPEGFAGSVAGVALNADGTTTTTLTTSPLNEVFNDIDIHSTTSSPAFPPTAAAPASLLRPRPESFECKPTVGLSTAATFDLENVHGTAEFSLSKQRLLMVVSGDVIAKFVTAASVGFSCDLQFPKVPIWASPPLIFFLQAGLSFSGTTTATIPNGTGTVKMPVSFGFLLDQGVLKNLSSATATGEAQAAAGIDISAAVNLAVSGKVAAELFGVFGPEISVGPQLTATFESDCIKVDASLVVAVDVVLDLWGIHFEHSALEYSLPLATLFETGACGKSHGWSGTVHINTREKWNVPEPPGVTGTAERTEDYNEIIGPADPYLVIVDVPGIQTFGSTLGGTGSEIYTWTGPPDCYGDPSGVATSTKTTDWVLTNAVRRATIGLLPMNGATAIVWSPGTLFPMPPDPQNEPDAVTETGGAIGTSATTRCGVTVSDSFDQFDNIIFDLLGGVCVPVLMNDTDPDPDHVVGTRSFTLSDFPPCTHDLNPAFVPTYFTGSITYDLTFTP